MLLQMLVDSSHSHSNSNLHRFESGWCCRFRHDKKRVFWSWSFLSRQGIGRWNVALASIQTLGMPKYFCKECLSLLSFSLFESPWCNTMPQIISFHITTFLYFCFLASALTSLDSLSVTIVILWPLIS